MDEQRAKLSIGWIWLLLELMGSVKEGQLVADLLLSGTQ